MARNRDLNNIQRYRSGVLQTRFECRQLVERALGFIARLVSTDLSGHGVLDPATRQLALTATKGA